MKRNLLGILTLVVMTVMISSTGAYAQAHAKANVPFEFMVGSAQLPAGSYDVSVTNTSSGTIMIRNDQTSAGALSVARSETPRNTHAKLVFHKVGNQYFLAEIWRGSDTAGMIVPTSKQEKELEKELQVASNHSGGYEEVVVALN